MVEESTSPGVQGSRSKSREYRTPGLSLYTWPFQAILLAMALDHSHPLFRRFLDLFRESRYFEAHEAMEELWIEKGRVKGDGYQGFVQLAVALEHLRRDNPAGARSVIAKAAQKLDRIENDHAAELLRTARDKIADY